DRRGNAWPPRVEDSPAHIGQHAGAERPGQDARQIDNPDPRQWHAVCSSDLLAILLRTLHRVPAKAGIHLSAPQAAEEWVPAFAGTRRNGAAQLSGVKRRAEAACTGFHRDAV